MNKREEEKVCVWVWD